MNSYSVDRGGRNQSSRFNPQGGRFTRKPQSTYNQNVSYQRKYPMGFLQLKGLLGKDPLEVTLTLKSERSGFKELLREDHLGEEKMAIILNVLALACTCPRKENLSETLKMINDIPAFLLQLEGFLTAIEKSSVSSISSFNHLAVFLEALKTAHPITSMETLDRFIPKLKRGLALHQNLGGHSLESTVHLLSGNSFSTDQTSEVERNFRNVSVFPSCEDFEIDPYLKPNVVLGKYESVGQYLDVQFRLFREDYVRPLRAGVASYREQTAEGVNFGFKDVRVYRNVRLSEALLTVDDGIVHKVRFDYDGPINWESSKRLIYGSLLCLSVDEFQSILVATVVASKPYELRRGIVYLRFAKEHLDEANKLRNKKFVAIETDAYFEAYRHVLTVLQEFECHNFPMKEYIVYGMMEPKSPNYLSHDNKYCFNSLTDHTEWGRMEGILFSLANMLTERKESLESTCKCLTSRGFTCYSATEASSWPSENVFSLDHSQMAAFKSALTQKLSVIQGPPGTGKTHVGLKIVNALLHNQLYSTSRYMKYPILVVCFTNHALDQFLEGVLKLTRKVVRVGGRSTSTALEQHNLRHLKRTSCNDFTRSYRFSVRNLLESSIARIDAFQRMKNDADVCILSETDLENDIPNHHLSSLYRNHPACLELSANPGNFITSWLGSWFPAHFFIEHEGYLYLWIDEISSYEELIPLLEDTDCSELLHQAFANLPTELSSQVNQHQPLGGEYFESECKYSCPKQLEEIADVDFIRAQRMEDGDILQDATVIYETLSSLKCGSQTETFVSAQLKCEPFSEIEAILCRNVWTLRMPDRWRMYKYWLTKFHARIQINIDNEKNTYDTNLKLYDELRQERERLVTQDFEVVGMTTTGAAKYKHLMKGLKPRVVIVEEAAEVLEAHVISSLSENTQHLILIGDHQQLRPNPTCYELAKDYGLDVSLFERLINNGLPFVRLGIQHRMRPCISQLLVPHIYKCLEDHSSVFDYENVLGMERNVFFLNHTIPEEQSCTSKSNRFEAEYLIALCGHLLLQGYETSQITILATYLAQFALLKRLASEQKSLDGVKITVVDNYQGEENDIILLSFVRSNDRGSIGFLKTHNRVCVSLSRAKKGLYAVGNFDLLANESQLWRNITTTLLENKAIGSSIKTKCQNHGRIFAIRNAKDFLYIDGGGCTKPCEFVLSCGHSCAKLCHPLDPNHEEYKCKFPCSKVNKSCEYGHTCSKVCSEICGNCMYLIPKILRPCLHKTILPCSTDPEDISCKAPCLEYLSCGHQCPSLCWEECPQCVAVVSKLSPCGHMVNILCTLSHQTQNLLFACTEPCHKKLACGHGCSRSCGSVCATDCSVLLERRLSCGHDVKIECSRIKLKEELLKHCSSPCGYLLECGHVCRGSCGQCVQGRLHIPCEEKCDKRLICGHIIKSSRCSRPYPPCKQKCRNSCLHRKCPLPCSFICLPCKKPCAWKCEHMTCSKTCGELCDRPPCDVACPKTLPCGHKCLGWCGEPCPLICASCSTVTVLEKSGLTCDQLSDTVDKLIQLDQCGHVFKWSKLEALLQEQQRSVENKFKIEVLGCPICQAPIGRFGRLGILIHTVEVSIEQVKRNVFGNRTENNDMTRDLMNRIKNTSSSKAYNILENHFPEVAFLKRNLFSKMSNKKRGMLRTVLVFIENYVTILEELSSVYYLLFKRVEGNLELRSFIRYTISNISKRMAASFERINRQLIKDLELELRRLGLLANTKIDLQHHPILKSGRFEENERDTAEQKFLALKNCSDFTSGNWYRCSSGHMFYVTPSSKEVDFICDHCKLNG